MSDASVRDGTLAVALDDGTVEFWDLASGARTLRTRISSRALKRIAWTAQGSLAASDEQGTMCIVRPVEPHRRDCTSLPMVPSALTAATAGILGMSEDGRVVAFADGVARELGSTGFRKASRLGVTSDGALLVATSTASGAAGWRLPDLKTAWARPEGSFGLALAGRSLALTRLARPAVILDAHSGALRRMVPGTTDALWVAVGSGNAIATGGHEGTVQIWNATTGSKVQVLAGDRYTFANKRARPVGGFSSVGPFSVSRGGTVRVWPRDGHDASAFTGAWMNVCAVGIDEGGEHMAIVDAQGNVWSLGLSTSEAFASVGRKEQCVTAPPPSIHVDEGPRILLGGGRTVDAWVEVRSGWRRETLAVAKPRAQIGPVSFGKTDMAISLGDSVMVQAGDRRTRLPVKDPLCSALSRDGSHYIASTRDGMTELWDVDAKQRVSTSRGPPAIACALTPDASRFVLAFEGAAFEVQERGGKSVGRASTQGDVAVVAWSGDASLVALGTARGVVDVWRADPLALVGRYETGDGRLAPVSLQFVGGRRAVVAGWKDGRMDILSGRAELEGTLIVYTDGEWVARSRAGRFQASPRGRLRFLTRIEGVDDLALGGMAAWPEAFDDSLLASALGSGGP